MADAERLEGIADIGRRMIEWQLALATKEPGQALKDLWGLGYCFGVFDALAQRAKLDDGAEGFGLITISFLGLANLSEQMTAANWVRRALDSQTNASFQQGAVAGVSDIFRWLADTSEHPKALFEHLI
jgi:hypothetical protein